MTSSQDTAVQKLKSNSFQQMLGRTTHEHINKMHSAIAAVYAEANTPHESFPLGSKFEFSVGILNKDKYIALRNTVVTGLVATANLADTCSFIHSSWSDRHDNTIEVSRRKMEAHCAELITQYKTFKGYGEAFKDKIVLACDKVYLVTIKNELFGFADKNVAQMLDHLEQQCLALTVQDKKTKMKNFNIPWDQDDDIETYFIKAKKLEEEIQENYGIECPTSMKIT